MVNKCDGGISGVLGYSSIQGKPVKKNDIHERTHQLFDGVDFEAVIPLGVKVKDADKYQKIQTGIRNIAQEFNFEDRVLIRLYRALRISFNNLAAIVEAADLDDGNGRHIYASLLRMWRPEWDEKISGLTSFFSSQTPEQMASHTVFFQTYGNEKILQDDLIFHLAMFFLSREDYTDFVERAEKKEDLRGLVGAARLSIYKEYTLTVDAANDQAAGALLSTFFIDYIKKTINSGVQEAVASILRKFLIWLRSHPHSWERLLSLDPVFVIDQVIDYFSYQEKHISIRLPELDVFIEGCRKNPEHAWRLIEFFDRISQDPGQFFKMWVEEDQYGSVCDDLLLLKSNFIQNHKKSISTFINVLNNSRDILPVKKLSSLLTSQKIKYLDVLCQWIQWGNAELAIAVCTAYTSNTYRKNRIGLLALEQDVEMARVVLLLTYVEGNITIPQQPKKAKKLNGKQKEALTGAVLDAICGKEGVTALVEWMQHSLGIYRAVDWEKYKVAELFFKLPPDVREKVLKVCSLVKVAKERAHVLQVLATYPAEGFLDLLLANPSRKFVKALLNKIPNPKDLLRVLEVYEHLLRNTAIPHIRSKGPFLGESTIILEYLKAYEPKLAALVKKVLADTSKLGRRMKVAMADWCRYGHKDSLVAFFNAFPIGPKTNSMGQIDPVQKKLWKEAVLRLECGRMGHIDKVLAAVALNKYSVTARAIQACKAFEDPKLLTQLLKCNAQDDESDKILRSLIDAPLDPWNRFLLHVKAMGHGVSCQPYLDASPGTTHVYKRLVTGNRIHLAKQLAANKNFHYTARYIGLSLKVNPAANLSPVKRVWIRSCKLARDAKKGKRTSLVAYDKFRDNDEYIEQYKEVALGLSIAQCIIPDGLLPKTRLEDVLDKIPAEIIGSDHYDYLKNIIHILQHSDDVRDEVVSLGQSFHLSPVGVAIINGLLSRDPDYPVSMQEIRVALLSALMCRPRQAIGVGSCFAVSEMIRQSVSIEGVSRTLCAYKQILEKGVVSLYSPEKQAMEEFPVVIRPLELGLGLPLLHPLVKALEYAVATNGNIKSESRVVKARDAIFNPGGLLEAPLNQLYQSYKQIYPTVNPFDIPQLLNDLKETFDRLAIELFNPNIQIGDDIFSGWELFMRNGLREISNLTSYKDLFKQVVKETFLDYRKRFFVGTLSYNLIHEFEAAMIAYFDPASELSGEFVNILITQLKLKREADLWLRDQGGNTGNILAGFQQMEAYPRFSFGVTSCEEAFLYLLHFCYDLPARIRKAAAKKMAYYLPLGIPSHSVNLLPHPLLVLLDKHDNPRSVMTHLQKNWASLSTKTLTLQESSDLAAEILQVANDQISFFEPTRYKNAMKNYLFEGMTYRDLAQLSLKEIALACGEKQPPIRTIIGIIDKTIYAHSSHGEANPLCIFADANWSEIDHGDALLAFGWSFASDRLEVFVTNKRLKQISLLSWNLIKPSGWSLYAPSQVYKTPI